jgi:hypothetical protein
MKLVTIAGVAGVLLVSGYSRADNVTTTFASVCVGETPADQPKLSWRSVNGQMALLNTDTVPHTVFCPITKTTSNTNMSNDGINLIGANFASQGNGGSWCRVKVWQNSNAAGFYGAQVVEDQGQVGPPLNPGTTYVYSFDANGTGTSAVNWWGSSTSWFFGEMICSLDSGAALSWWQMDEFGTNQNRMIVPSSGGTAAGNYDFGGGLQGVEAIPPPEGQNGSFTWNAVWPANSTSNLLLMVDSLAGGIPAQQILTCAFGGKNYPVPYHGGSNSPNNILTFSRTAHNANGPFSCTSTLVKGGPTSLGDAAIYSYKMW